MTSGEENGYCKNFILATSDAQDLRGIYPSQYVGVKLSKLSKAALHRLSADAVQRLFQLNDAMCIDAADRRPHLISTPLT